MELDCQPGDTRRACHPQRKFFKPTAFEKNTPYDVEDADGSQPPRPLKPQSSGRQPRRLTDYSRPNPYHDDTTGAQADQQRQRRHRPPSVQVGNVLPRTVQPTLKEMPFAVRQKANMVLASRQALRTNYDDAQELLDDRGVAAEIDRDLSTTESLVLVGEDGKVTVAYRGTEPTKESVKLREDVANDAKIAVGKENFPDSKAQMERVIAKYGTPDEVVGYSLGGARAMNMVQEFPELQATLLNPWLGPKTLQNPSPAVQSRVHIYRTTEDYATAIGMGLHGSKGWDIDTVHPLKYAQTKPMEMDVHSIENFSEQGPRMATSHAEDMHNMVTAATAHQDNQTLHEISKAQAEGKTFTEWMKQNEAQDVTADGGFTERVNKSDFRARYWKEAGGTFTPEEQAHLDSTPAPEIPAEGERARQRARFAKKSIPEQASSLQTSEAQVKTAIEKVNASTQEHAAALKEYTAKGSLTSMVTPGGVAKGLAKGGTGLVSTIVADKIVGALDPGDSQPDFLRELETGALAGAGTVVGEAAAATTVAAITGGAASAAAAAGSALAATVAAPAVVAGGVGYLAGSEVQKGVDSLMEGAGVDKDASGAISNTVGGAVGGGASVLGAIGTATLMGAEIGEFGGIAGLAVGTGLGAVVGLGSWVFGKLFGKNDAN